MAGELQYDSQAGANQGRLLYCEAGVNLGKLVFECCCIENGVKCEFCSGNTPRFLLAVFSGINLCDCFMTTAPGGPYAQIVSVDPNVSIRMEQNIAPHNDPCIWTGTQVIAGSYRSYGLPPPFDCSVFDHAHNLVVIRATLVLTLNQRSLYLSSLAADNPAGAPDAAYFERNQVVVTPIDCLADWNTTDQFDCTAVDHAAEDGAATVTAD